MRGLSLGEAAFTVPEGASEAQVEAWVERFIDASVKPAAQEIDHAR